MRGIGQKSRRIKTLWGDVIYTRAVAECPACRRSVAPLDLELGVQPGGKLTLGVRRKVAFAASQSSFGAAAMILKELAQMEVSAAECARVANDEGKRLDALQREREAAWVAPVRCEARVAEAEIECKKLVVEADATCVLTVTGEEHKSVLAGVAFDATARGEKEDGGRRFLAAKRYTASAEGMEDFGPRLKALANRMGLRQACQVAFVGDGATSLWKWAEQNLPPDTVMIQDYWHVCEHLCVLAKDIHGSGEKSEAIAKRWREALRQGLVGSILDDLEAQRKRRRGAKRKRIEQEITYLTNGRHRMDYARLEAEGWPIGSGAIEGTCKHLVKERFSITGAHWRRDNIANVLALRLSRFNEEWECAWEKQLSLN